MKLLTCIIIDDELGAHRVLENYISIVKSLELKGSFLNAIDAFYFLKNQPVDIVFLDINMPEIDGFTFIKMLTSPPNIIVTSAYSEYAIEGYDFNVVDYLLKPIRIERFVKAIEKVKGSNESTKPKLIDSIEVKYEGGNKQFSLADIHYFQSVGNYVKIVTSTKNYIIHMTTNEIESKLINSDFIRIHKSFIVNKNLIKKIDKDSMDINGKNLPIGKTFKKYIAVFLS